MHDLISLNSLTSGECGEISHYESASLPAKFYELGLQPGALVFLQHKAPLQGPICLHVLETDTLIALRRSEAKRIIVRKVS
jgi:ferrous iron transport protein A